MYPGYDDASPLYTTIMLLNIKRRHNITQTIFNEFVSIMKSVLPRENKLKGSFYDSKKLMKKLRMR